MSRGPRAAAAALLAAAVACGGGAAEPRPAPPARTSAAPSPPGPELPASIAALGDSMTRAFLVCNGIADCPEASWSTGTFEDVASHLHRVERAAGRRVTAHNVAVSGALVAGLAAQVGGAVAAGPEYVTILVGANDACAPSEQSMTPVAEFAASFDGALRALVRDLPRAAVLVASIPDLLRLWEIGAGRPEVRAVWERYGICQSMLRDPQSTSAADTARRARVRDRVAAFNAAMARSCARYATCRWDGNAVFDYDFTLDEVSSRDYWHPSRAGQRALAEVTWRAGFWPG